MIDTKHSSHHRGRSYINDKLKLVYIPIPKCASTSVRYHVLQSDYDTRDYYSLDPTTLAAYNTFTIIRNPFDRLNSGYIELLRNPQPHITNKKFYHMQENISRYYEFLDELERGLFDCHIEAQSYFLDGIKLDNILILENIQHDIKHILDTTLPVIRNSPNYTPLEQFFKRPDVIKRIMSLYENDINLYQTLTRKK